MCPICKEESCAGDFDSPRYSKDNRVLGDAIFLLSVLCMKDNWRAGIPDKDKTELVTNGIYRFSRNPAFLGFDLMYVGALLLYGNLLTLGFSVFAIVMLHLQILQEER